MGSLSSRLHEPLAASSTAAEPLTANAGPLKAPLWHLILDQAGHAYVSDQTNNTIQKFNLR